MAADAGAPGGDVLRGARARRPRVQGVRQRLQDRYEINTLLLIVYNS